MILLRLIAQSHCHLLGVLWQAIALINNIYILSSCLRVVERLGACLSHRHRSGTLVLELWLTFAREADLMLLLHLIDLSLLLLHDFGQLKLVLELLGDVAASTLRGRLLVIDREHLLLPARLVHVYRASCLLLYRLELIGYGVGLSDLIRHS